MYIDYGLLALRVLAGIGIMTHGIPKLRDLKSTMSWMQSIGLPRIAGVFSAIVETVGGLLLIVGVATQMVAGALLLNMLGALFYHLKAKHTFKGMEDAYLYAIIFFAIALAGGGKFELYGTHW